MALIGTRALAREAHDIVLDNVYGSNKWSCIGTGSFRSVWVHDSQSDVVYKVPAGVWGDREYENARELVNARLMRKRTDLTYVRIPKVSGFNIDGTLVLAMERAPGIMGRCIKGHVEARKELHSLNFGDMHGMNYFINPDTGHIWPIDMASPRNSAADNRVIYDSGE